MSKKVKLTVKKVFGIKDDFQNVFLSKSGIHIRPKFEEMKLVSRTINEIHYDDLYIIEPGKYYYIEFNESDYSSMLIYEVVRQCGLIINTSSLNRVYLYNATMNIQYIQKGMEIGEGF